MLFWMIASEKKYLPGRWKWKEICLLNWVQKYVYSLEEESSIWWGQENLYYRSNDKLTSGAMCYFTPVIGLRQGV